MHPLVQLYDKLAVKEKKQESFLCNTCNLEITHLNDNLNYCFSCDKFFFTNVTGGKLIFQNLTVSQFENKVIHLTSIIHSVFKNKNVYDKVQVVKAELKNRNISVENVQLDDIYRIIKDKNLKTYNSATEILNNLKLAHYFTENKLSGQVGYISNDIIRVIEAFFLKLFHYVYRVKKTNYTINYSFFLDKLLTFIGVEIGFKPKMLKNNKKHIENTHLWDGFVRDLDLEENKLK